MIPIEQARALTGHTKGPWRLIVDEQRDEVVIGTGFWDTDANGFSEFDIATLWSGMGKYSSASGPITDQCAANARLTAPDLLALALSQAAEIERLQSALEYAAGAAEQIVTCVKANANRQPEKLSDVVSIANQIGYRAKDALGEKP